MVYLLVRVLNLCGLSASDSTQPVWFISLLEYSTCVVCLLGRVLKLFGLSASESTQPIVTMLPVSKTGYLLLLVISAIVCQLLLFYSSSYWVSWEIVIGEVVEPVIDGKKDVYEETVDGEKYAYEELRIRLGENVKSLKDPGIQQD